MNATNRDERDLIVIPATDVRKCPKMSELSQSTPAHDIGLTEKQQNALRLLVMGKSISVIARTLDINPRTLHRWRQLDAFRRELNSLRRHLWSQAVERLRSLVHPSLDVFEEQLHNPHERSRYRAANAVLRHANLKKCVPLADSIEDCEEEPHDYD
jgi:transposase-like protein